MKSQVRHADITVERLHDGHLLLYAIIDRYFVRRHYFGFTVREARQLFREEHQ